MTHERQTLLRVRNLDIGVELRDENDRMVVKPLVEGVSFDIGKGEVLGLIGESGAGKSTIGLATMGYGRGPVSITGGEIWLDDVDITRQGPVELRALRGRRICYVAQSAAGAFNPSHKLIDQVVEGALEHAVMSRREAERRAIDLFRKLQLPDPETIGNRYSHQVSGGQLQRIMTAMALCADPDLIIFDEPTTALDVTTQIDVLAAIKDAIRDVGVAAIYVTHDLAVVTQVADRIMVLRHGRMVEFGETRQIIEAPTEEYTRALVSVNRTGHPDRSSAEQTVLKIDGVHASYGVGGVKVLEDVSVELGSGETLAVVGESGSGKSTLARAIVGLLPPTEGSIAFAGRRLPPMLKDRTKADLQKIQLIYQMADVAMNPRHTIGKIIGRPIDFYFGVSKAERNRRVCDLLARVELDEEFFNRYPAELSGGQKQRVCIARALAAQPKVIICDEVTSALDPLVADSILKLLLNLQADSHVSYLFITHDLATVKSIADSIAVMHRGKVVRYGRKSDVLAPPFDAYTDLLLSSVPEMRPGWLEDTIASRRMESAGH